MKKIFLSLVVLLLLMCSVAYADEAPKIFVDGKELVSDSSPMVINGRTLVPLRLIFEALGKSVNWNPNDRSIVSGSISLQIGNKVAKVNNKEVSLDVPAQLIKNRTYVPLRFISESLGYNVEWDSLQNKIKITVKKLSPNDLIDMFKTCTLETIYNNGSVLILKYSVINNQIMNYINDISLELNTIFKEYYYNKLLSCKFDTNNSYNSSILLVYDNQNKLIAYLTAYKNLKFNEHLFRYQYEPFGLHNVGFFVVNPSGINFDVNSFIENYNKSYKNIYEENKKVIDNERRAKEIQDMVEKDQERLKEIQKQIDEWKRILNTI
ncbi:MAG: copper amine oxidase N-terminal domain-containing protein [Bacillota bacterium]